MAKELTPLMLRIYEMTGDELRALLIAYEEYIQEANDEDKFHSGWRPVCISEFIDCEFAELQEE